MSRGTRERGMDPKLQMTDDELESFLNSYRTMRVATNGPDGYPHVVPVGYLYHDGALFFPSNRDTQKVVNIRNDEQVCCSQDEGRAALDSDSLKGVMFQGQATIYEVDEHEEVSHQDIVEHLWAGDVEEGGDREDPEGQFDRSNRIVVEVVPTNVVSWDFSKLAAE